MKLRDVVGRRFGADTRALAAFRVALAGLVLADLALRSRSLVAFYTDAGVMPRQLLFERYPEVSQFSVHALSGAAWVQGALFVLAAVVALAMLVGYRTTLATAVTGLLLVSLHYRNPMVLNGGDILFRMLFLWAIFLPLGERWSVDAVRSDGHRRRALSVATAGVLLQVVVVYSVNAALKLRSDVWKSGEAIEYVFSLDMFVVGMGDTLAQYPELLAAFDRLWISLVAGSFLLLVLTGWLRAALVGLFAAMHIGMATSMQLGLFPLISVAALLPFLPSVFWDRLPARGAVPVLRDVPVSRWEHRLGETLPPFALPTPPERVRLWWRRSLSGGLAVVLVVVLVWNAATVGFVAIPQDAPVNSDPSPRWNMFAPAPLGTDAWFTAPATLDSGERVDAFQGGTFEWEKPPDVSATYPSARWRKYLTNVHRSNSPELSSQFAGYLCERWDARHDSALRNVSVYAVLQPTRLDGPEPTRRVELAERNCSG
ncbi:HTTM domain-containing protein [Halobacterium wangiae]|uniref:HTTM domain-containing protein n=1 Tax=Halobacterium wangiae TaxID=2902623 RepID=UPI001E533882|nr:HTTM domain-containing protein [Halobacterium wangiae]